MRTAIPALALLSAMFCAVPAVAVTRDGAGPLPVSVSTNGHYLVTSDGKPFFWLADTAWELIHSTTREEEIEGGKRHDFKSPPQGPDWVLVLDDAAKHYAPPGLNP